MSPSHGSSFIRPEEFWRTVGLRAEQTVVHLGCGAGFFLVPAAKIVGSRGKAIGIDIRADMLAEAENRAGRLGVADALETHRADLEGKQGSGLSVGLADWVLVANILHQADPEAVLGEAARVVKADGTVVVLEWDTAATPFGPPAHTRLSPAQVEAVAHEVGLRVVLQERPSPYHFALLLRKTS